MLWNRGTYDHAPGISAKVQAGALGQLCPMLDPPKRIGGADAPYLRSGDDAVQSPFGGLCGV